MGVEVEEDFIYPVKEYSFLRDDYGVMIVFDNRIWGSAKHIYEVYSLDRQVRGLAKDLPLDVLRECNGYFETDKECNREKEELLYLITKTKFEQHPVLLDKLIRTGNATIVYGLLGHVLMRVREELRDTR